MYQRALLPCTPSRTFEARRRRGASNPGWVRSGGVAGEPEALKEGEWILYDVEETHKGPEAAEIEPYTGDTDLLT